ncbi:hypothetical protein FRB91_011348 [Serendipita sp. 411]|nr:hypothetical protein FRB91_011348 [Serendipita sp. 411]
MHISAFVLSIFLLFSTFSRFANGVPLPHGPSGQGDIQNAAATKESIASPALPPDLHKRAATVTYPPIHYAPGLAPFTGDRLAAVEQYITQRWHAAGRASGAWTATAVIMSATHGITVVTPNPPPQNGNAIMTHFDPSTLTAQLHSPVSP